MYEYNSDGLRTFRRGGSNSYNYYYDGDRLIAQKWGGNKYILFHYDESDSIYAITYCDGTTTEKYNLFKNLQGDVVEVRSKYNALLASYNYDPWGNVVSITDSSGNEITDTTHIAHINPIRYRSYYYDDDTGFYYISNRYYDPEIGRFISADDIDYLGADGSPLSYNLFAYCKNNPINRFDVNGNWSMPNWLKVTIGAVATVAAVAVTVATGGAAAPVLIGVATSTIGGAAVSAVNHRVTTGSWEGAGKAALDGAADGFMWGGIGAFASSSISAVKAVKTAKQGIAIGENMERVGKAAQVVDATTYKPMKGYKAIKILPKVGQQLADDLSLAHNKAFITRMTKLGAPIYDTGSVGSSITSRWYAMERQVVNGYFNYVKMF